MLNNSNNYHYCIDIKIKRIYNFFNEMNGGKNDGNK